MKIEMSSSDLLKDGKRIELRDIQKMRCGVCSNLVSWEEEKAAYLSAKCCGNEYVASQPRAMMFVVISVKATG